MVTPGRAKALLPNATYGGCKSAYKAEQAQTNNTGKEGYKMTNYKNYTTDELKKKYPVANYATRDRIKCGLTCSSCMYCVYGNDAHKQDNPDNACFCVIG